MKFLRGRSIGMKEKESGSLSERERVVIQNSPWTSSLQKTSSSHTNFFFFFLNAASNVKS
jgi:hypothetical protein